ncbi:hypothetical protein M087_3551 [Bacteroides fragilis str. S23 R14]|uniref:Uncharacterized protein n=1 Tax=Bacteroides fragilis str. 3998T(B)3 TaxID=1339316 RepID=A0A015X8G9_BACFG|nr:hypothetical protein M125_4426 [Bacteroides fragilis str. 3998T(B)3]EXY94068.1 hypothetical protein M081_3899 [Bacteroides fragilis str. 3998 T(B) 4]EXZ99002.1 hypothetical protein M087_3551 [Bacteroides fragilis str. S23 R14]EYA64906.1 hypothetical protein M139_3876 [Bacteroides fragilis str. S23L24]EYE42354.1 hypothetical protein M138_3813 [Bacteroides fragilis str. S23L17]
MFECRYKGKLPGYLLLTENCELERLTSEMSKCGDEVNWNS